MSAEIQLQLPHSDSAALLADFKTLNWKEHGEILSTFCPSPDEVAEAEALKAITSGYGGGGRKKKGGGQARKKQRVTKGAPKKAPAAKPKKKDMANLYKY